MQQAIYIQKRGQFFSRTPEQGAGSGSQVLEDGQPRDSVGVIHMVFSVLGNVLGGALLLSAMLILPQVFAGLLAG